jgi:hypothetical protein
MNATPAAQQLPSDPAALAASLDDTDRLIKNCTSRTHRGNVMTIIVGILLLGLLGGYFYYGYSQISSVMEPETLVNAAQTWLDDQLPQVRRQLEAQIDKSAPEWAENLSKQAQSSLPTIREKLEGYVLEQVDQTVEQTVTITEDKFRQFLRDRRDLLETGFKDLSTSPELAKESLSQLEAALNESMQTDMKQGASDLYATLTQMTEKLAHLHANQHLTPQETLERQILMQLRRLQLEEVGPLKAEEIGSATSLIDAVQPGQ